MTVYPFSYVNLRGIPVIESTGVTVTTDAVIFTFPNHSFANSQFRGKVIARLAQSIPAGTTTTLPIQFSTNGVLKNLTTFNGANVTVANIPGTGFYDIYYDKRTDVLQLQTGAL